METWLLEIMYSILIILTLLSPYGANPVLTILGIFFPSLNIKLTDSS